MQTQTQTQTPHASLITVITSKENDVLKLLSYCFQQFKYINIEWIIVDDGNNISEYIPNDERIHYYHFDNKTIRELYDQMANSIKEKRKTDKKNKLLIRKPFINIPVGMKRNLATSYATGSYILNFEPYCYYSNDYIDNVIQRFPTPTAVECISTDEIGHFHTKRYISIITKQPERGAGAKKYCIPLIAYNKSYWNERKFNNQDKDSEFDSFFRKRKLTLTAYDKNVVRLYHIDDENMFPKNLEANGWHFQAISDDIYDYITTFG